MSTPGRDLTFSVVIPTYNRPATLAMVLDRAMRQTVKPAEIIVVDDASTTDLAPLRQRFPAVRFIRLGTQAGPAAARNVGFRSAQGTVVSFVDDDVLPDLDWIERHLDGFCRFPDVVGVAGSIVAPPEVLRANFWAQFELFQSVQELGQPEHEVIGGWECPGFATCNVSYLKSVLQAVEGFDESFPCASTEDADLKFRIAEKGYRLLWIPQRLVHLRAYDMRTTLRRALAIGKANRIWQQRRGQFRPRYVYALRLALTPAIALRDLARYRFDDVRFWFAKMAYDLVATWGRLTAYYES